MLDGPKDGQSYESWQTELKALHDEMYPETVQKPPKPKSDEADQLTLEGPDLCLTPISDWVMTDSNEQTSDAIGNAGVLSQLKHNLALYFQYVLQFETDGIPDILIPVPTVTKVTCTKCSMDYLECLENHDPPYCKKYYLNCSTVPSSAISVEVPIYQAGDKPKTSIDDVYLGTVSVEASMFHTDVAFFEWCVHVSSYSTQDFSPLELLVAKPMIDEALKDSPFCFSAFAGQEVPLDSVTARRR